MKSYRKHISSLKTLPAIAIILISAIVVASCGGDKKEFVNIEVDYEVTPTMKTLNVETLISDSGMIRYQITAPVWLVFDNAKEPRWSFAQGLHLEKYDNNRNIDARFDCDSALYKSQRKIWRFDGNVHAKNTANDRFDTEQLFWDQNDKKIYTDSFIHIEKSDRIIEGYGFVSNENMTEYTVNRVSGIFPVNEKRDDSITTENPDTLKVNVDTIKRIDNPKQIPATKRPDNDLLLNREAIKAHKLKIKSTKQ